MSPPEVHELTPLEGTEMRGVGYVNVHVEFSDESDVTLKLLADGYEVDRLEPECSGDVCTADAIWDNTGLPAGPHTLGIVLEDSHGNVAHRERDLLLEDVLAITSMQVDNIVDEYGSLEIEVYAFAEDTGGELIGCAGSRQRLDFVDSAGSRYQTEAVLIRPDQDLLADTDMGARRYRLEVWEDDDDPVCPVVPLAAGNDFLGASPAHTIDEWRQLDTVSFGQVPELGVAWSRPLHTGETPGTSDPTGDYDPWGNDGAGGAGCSTGGSSGFGALLLLALVRVRRRSNRP
jgi:uncharacterized protein (TIGR03382 family)